VGYGIFQEILAGSSILVGVFLAGRYFGILESRLRTNGKSGTIEQQLQLISLRLSEISSRLEQHLEEYHRNKRRSN
jgi:hypothetical protein